MACPASHAANPGFATAKIRKEWMAAHGLREADTATSLTANPDPAAPLYPWQLYSLLGFDNVHAIVRAFYTRVFADTDEPWFREAFTSIFTFEHHVATQTAFWADGFGGGRQYHGADQRISFHHQHNAHAVMNARGADRWMHHMVRALQEDMAPRFGAWDPRVLPCIATFLRLRMQKYARDHGWRFDPAPFDRLVEGAQRAELERGTEQRVKRQVGAKQWKKMTAEQRHAAVAATLEAEELMSPGEGDAGPDSDEGGGGGGGGGGIVAGGSSGGGGGKT